MTYQTPTSDETQAVYAAPFSYTGATGPAIYFQVIRDGGDDGNNEQIKAAFQAVVDLISAAPGFTLTNAYRHWNTQQEVTVTE